MDRRDFLKTAAGGACICTLADLPLPCPRPFSREASLLGPAPAMALEHDHFHEASYYNKLDHKEIVCVLCPRECVVGNKERGYCGVRENQEGTYYTLVYNRPCTKHTDPIEKKPFYHFYPRAQAFSLATAGCNMNCKYCQNWEISQVRPEQVRSLHITPKSCVDLARKECSDRSGKGKDPAIIAYTYSEPVIFYEYMYDIAVEARKKGVKNVMVSAGFVEQKPLQDLLPFIDAVKIDLKAFSDDFYRKICRGRLSPVLEALKTIRGKGVWLEIVYLVLPTLNDTQKEIRALCRWILRELGPDVPIHFSRFHPTYLMKNLPPTPVRTLETLHKTALQEGLRYVYIGNVPGHAAGNTYCPECRKRVIHRTGYNIRIEAMDAGKCAHCTHPIPGRWPL